MEAGASGTATRRATQPRSSLRARPACSPAGLGEPSLCKARSGAASRGRRAPGRAPPASSLPLSSPPSPPAAEDLPEPEAPGIGAQGGEQARRGPGASGGERAREQERERERAHWRKRSWELSSDLCIAFLSALSIFPNIPRREAGCGKLRTASLLRNSSQDTVVENQTMRRLPSTLTLHMPSL